MKGEIAMNKTALKKFATEARIELLERVELKQENWNYRRIYSKSRHRKFRCHFYRRKSN